MKDMLTGIAIGAAMWACFLLGVYVAGSAA